MIALYILAAYFLLGAAGLCITYRRSASPFYGRLTLETVCLGLLCGPSTFLSEVWSAIGDVTMPQGINFQKVVFKRKS